MPRPVLFGNNSLSLYKTVAQAGDIKILLFKIKGPGSLYSTPVIARADADGTIRWAKAISPADPGHFIDEIDAIVLHNNNIFVYSIAESISSQPQWITIMSWLDENGNILLEKTYTTRIDEPGGISHPTPGTLKLLETASGNILSLSGHRLAGSSRNTGLIMNMNSLGDIAWQRLYGGPSDVYTPIGVAAYDNTLVLQGSSSRTGYPNNTILNTTKLSLSSGNIIHGKSYMEHSDVGAPASGHLILTADHQLKTLAYWRIPFYYQIYFSFTMDTSLVLTKSTSFHTSTSATSYLPASASLNDRGMSLIKTRAPDPRNTGYFIAGIDDNILQEKTILNSPYFEEYGGAGNTDVVFDNADSVYLYWDGTKNGKKIVGWIKTGIHPVGDFCSVKDSSFILTDDYPMSLFNWELAELGTGPASPVAFPVNYSAITISKELVCEKITGFCDPIKIRPVDTVCSITGPVRLTVKKNPECRGKILFSFDPFAVSNWQQPDDTTLLLQFNQSWEGFIYAGSSFCPLVKDSFYLVVSAPLPGIDLGQDTILCKGDSLKLVATGGFNSYHWQNGSTGPSLIVTNGGTYYLRVMDQCSRSYIDTIKIVLIDKKPGLGPDLLICRKETTSLTAKGNFISYAWDPSYHINSIDLKNVLVNPEITTTYHVTARTAEGCIAKDTVVVQVKDCAQTFYIPSAFTPNHDGKNDLFHPIIIAPLEEYEFSIYDRWGQRVFYSKDKSKGWDGRLAGIDQDSGVFVWMCNFKFYDQPAIFKKGSFILIR